MTAPDAAEVARIAAAAALRVPGVAGLDADLRQTLGRAAALVHAPGAGGGRPADGVRAGRTGAGGAWHVEIRCALHPHRRCLDTAREVGDRVGAALAARLATPAAAAPAPAPTVGVTITRLVPEARGS